MKRNPFSIRRIILIIFLCLVSISIIAQKINLDTLTVDQLNQYKHKAVKIRNTGMILTFSGVGTVIVSNIAGFSIANIPSDDQDDPWGGGFVAGILIVIIGTGVGIASTVVGIPSWAIGGIRKSKAEIALKKFDIVPENSLAFGVGITFRF